jgi:hypothetical protein
MPTPTYTPLATVTLGTAAASVTFSSIPATYRDLICVTSTFQTNAGDQYSSYRINGDTGANYNWVYMDTYPGTPSSGATSNATSSLWTYTQNVSSTTPLTTIVQFMDYSATDKHKTQLHRFGAASPTVGAYASRWANTAAVTSISILATSGNYQSGSTFSLYGVIA